ncbi:MAG: SRPBCC family protein [Pedobacter sp.]|uniref:SRPBCC family protein n=1 Tax=Pedobacter sp. TaxID=1411316 RepID=UPI0028094843|nr:SRPBCC family protein [Pedobacter sp.]MDQ8005688.1 SRPBCC family protein [Pedobacter sp.]
MENKKEPCVETQMLIRKTASEVFSAFIDPAVTTNFWFTKSTGKLEVGKSVNWQWEMYGASADVLVKEIIPNQKIIVEWGEPTTIIDFNFEAVDENSTYVVIKNYGFQETGDDLIAVIKDSTGGFTTVLDGLKAYLEHGLKLNLIGDKFLTK